MVLQEDRVMLAPGGGGGAAAGAAERVSWNLLPTNTHAPTPTLHTRRRTA